MKRVMWLVAIAIVVFCATLAGNLVYGAVTAQDDGTWQIAGAGQGFALADWGDQSPSIALDAFLDELPADCDFVMIDRGVSFKSVAYRCPD